jgi:hypothetical protein
MTRQFCVFGFPGISYDPQARFFGAYGFAFFLIPCGFQGFGGLLLSEKFVERLFQSHQLSINALRSTHLLSFGFCHVASVHISRSFQFPVYIFAFLMGCASKFAAKNNPLNFVPPLHEFILIERWLR